MMCSSAVVLLHLITSLVGLDTSKYKIVRQCSDSNLIMNSAFVRDRNESAWRQCITPLPSSNAIYNLASLPAFPSSSALLQPPESQSQEDTSSSSLPLYPLLPSIDIHQESTS